MTIIYLEIRSVEMRLLLMFVILSVSLSVAAQQRVVVIPMGSDVTAQQFNALVDQVNRSHVFSGFVESSGAKGGLGPFVSTRVSEGVYDVTVFPPLPQYDVANLQQPNVVVTSKDVARIPSVAIMDLLSDRIRFRVTLTAFDGNIANADFYFHLQFSEFSDAIDGPSDHRLKTNIRHLGVTSSGLNIYQFNYINDPTRTDFIGVMAQEVLDRQPEAVRRFEDGYYRVNYFQLGLRMSTREYWDQYGMGSIELQFDG